MSTTKSISLASSVLLTLAAAACTGAPTVAPGDDGDDGSGSGGGSNTGGGDDTPVLNPQGKFAMTETFDLATNMPGTAGEAVNIFISATDDPDDPTKFIVEKLVGALPDGSIKDNLQSAIPFVAGYLNDRLLSWAPSLVTKIVKLGNGFGQIAHNFGMIGTLDIGANNMATHAVTGFHFKVDATELDFPFSDYNIQPFSAQNVGVTLTPTGKLTIAEHALPMSYGTALRLGLDEVVIPMVDPDATSLADVLHDEVDCAAVGSYVYDAVGFGSPSTFQSACTAGLTAASGFVYSELAKLDTAALNFHITGDARGLADSTGKMTSMQTGSWTGTLDYAGTSAPLAPNAKFHGTRM